MLLKLGWSSPIQSRATCSKPKVPASVSVRTSHKRFSKAFQPTFIQPKHCHRPCFLRPERQCKICKGKILLLSTWSSWPELSKHQDMKRYIWALLKNLLWVSSLTPTWEAAVDLALFQGIAALLSCVLWQRWFQCTLKPTGTVKYFFFLSYNSKIRQ